MALPPKRRIVCLGGTAGVAAAVLAPLALISSGGFAASTRGIASTSAVIFQPWQIWWFLGHHGALVHGLFGAPKVGYRTGPSWVGVVSHPLILFTGLTLTAALWLRQRRTAGSGSRLAERDALLALALLLLMRCILDTWDTVYYPLPFIFALLAWEIQGPADRPPVLALSSTVLAWISFQWSPAHMPPDSQAAFFLAWSLPLTTLIAVALYAPRRTLVQRDEPLRQAREPFRPLLANHR